MRFCGLEKGGCGCGHLGENLEPLSSPDEQGGEKRGEWHSGQSEQHPQKYNVTNNKQGEF